MRFGSDPGSCPICGAAHTTCTANNAPITAVQLPARDQAAAIAHLERATRTAVTDTPIAMPPLGDGTDGQPFSSATYRGKKKRGISRP